MRASATQLRPCQRARQRGGAIVEFALLLTFLITLVAGIFEFGRTFWYYDAMSKATRNGARAMSVAAKAKILTAGVVQARDAMLADALSAGVPNFTIANIEIQCVAANGTAGACVNGTAPAGVRVNIIDYEMSLGAVVPFLVGSTSTYELTLAPSTTMPYMR